jgi:cellulose synthase/poly-beta-1,6-N-acetylglucosamine synthase-like glycosyltransferase
MTDADRSPLYRWLEIIPGILTWSTLILPIVLAFTFPKVVSIGVMIFALYWFMRAVVMAYHLIKAYRAYHQAMRQNWKHELMTSHPQTWENVVHLVFIPMYKEELGTVKTSFEAIKRSDYPLNKISVILCTEERAGDYAQTVAKQLKREYGRLFRDFFITVHPADTAGEVKGKGANISYAARAIVPQLLQSGVKAEDIMVTTIDADNRVDKQYFAAASKIFLDSPDSKHTSYQPLPMYFNNIWDVPIFVRMMALGSSFWTMIEATRPERLRNFSAHSQSLTGLMACDYWSVTTIVEDGHQYWRSLYRFHGKHTVVPIFVPIYQDAVLSHSLWGTIKEQYLQRRRWAWGVTDVPYVFVHNLRDTSMPFTYKWKQFYRLFEGNYSLATTSLVLAIGSWPPILINAAYQKTVFAYNFPDFYSYILLLAGAGMIVTLVISTLILPPPPAYIQKHRWRLMFDWALTPILLPITSIIFSTIPAIDAQTRLMFGSYLEFRVTLKKVLEEKPEQPVAKPRPSNTNA